jgi:membrane protein
VTVEAHFGTPAPRARPSVWSRALVGLFVALTYDGTDRRDVERRRPPTQRGAAPAIGGKEHEAPAAAAAEPGRGRHARTPSEIPARGWKDILLRVYREVSDDRVFAIAAGVTYYGLLAIFPAIASLVSIYGLFADPATMQEHLGMLSTLLPAGAIQIIGEQMQRVASKGSATLGFAFVMGLAVSLWSANAGMKAIFDALNIVYDETEKRNFLKLNATSLTFTFAAILFILVAIGAVVVLPIVLNFIGLGSVSELLLTVLRWPALLVIVAGMISLLYRYGPSRAKAKWRWITWGSSLASVLWLGVSMLFSWYAANFGSYDETYGSLGAVIGFMVWLWLSASVILLGAEIDAEMEHQTLEDSTTGAPKPLGARGAAMADKVGPRQGA